MKFYRTVLTVVRVGGVLLVAALSVAQTNAEIVIGLQCDRTGPTQVVGAVLCPGEHDYIALVNSKGGVEGYTIKAEEIDHEYKVRPAVEMASTVFYNRGVLVAALHVEAIRNALKAHADGKITGADVKAGFEKFSNFTLGGLVPPLKITPADHEGGGLVQIWQVKGGKFVRITDWYSAYPEVVATHIKEVASKS